MLKLRTLSVAVVLSLMMSLMLLTSGVFAQSIHHSNVNTSTHPTINHQHTWDGGDDWGDDDGWSGGGGDCGCGW